MVFSRGLGVCILYFVFCFFNFVFVFCVCIFGSLAWLWSAVLKTTNCLGLSSLACWHICNVHLPDESWWQCCWWFCGKGTFWLHFDLFAPRFSWWETLQTQLMASSFKLFLYLSLYLYLYLYFANVLSICLCICILQMACGIDSCLIYKCLSQSISFKDHSSYLSQMSQKYKTGRNTPSQILLYTKKNNSKYWKDHPKY